MANPIRPAFRTIRQAVSFRAAPRAVYDILMNSRRHAAFTGARASISQKVGGRIMAYDGYIRGVNLELDPGRKIVQSWRASDWAPGVESRVSFLLRPTRGGTRLEFTHRGVPAEQVEDLRRGWVEHYWEKMSQVLDGPPAPPRKKRATKRRRR